jgi:hypothetical protein
MISHSGTAPQGMSELTAHGLKTSSELQNNTLSDLIIHEMAPATPKRKTKRREYNTIKRTRFFDAFDSRNPGQGVGQIAKLPKINIPPSTARLWIKERDKLGNLALRSQRNRSSILGRRTKVSEQDLEHLIDQSNPLHEKSYTEQAKELPNRPSERTLHRHYASINASRFKKPFTTEVSSKNKQKRVEYGQKHEKETLIGYWRWIWFTDEAHFQSIKLQNTTEYKLRVPGQERQCKVNKESGLDVTLHVAAGVCYDHKGPLIFYKDPQQPSEKVRKPAPPRQSKYETQEQFQARLKVFEDTQPKEDTTPKGNCMTQVFYAQKILPEHIKEIKMMEERYKHSFYLQEDGDPSHGNRSENNPPWCLKRDSDLSIFVHPPQSPDLNPVEACWLILKKRLRGREWSTVAQFKADIQAEWRKITVAQIRRRIREMPERCRKVQASGGERIKSTVW